MISVKITLDEFRKLETQAPNDFNAYLSSFRNLCNLQGSKDTFFIEDWNSYTEVMIARLPASLGRCLWWLRDTSLVPRVSVAGLDLSRLDLSGSCFYKLDLTEVDLSYSDLTDANFANTRLSGANLTKANLHSTLFSGATLEAANLQEALVWNTDFTQANLSGVNLEKSKLICGHFYETKRNLTDSFLIPWWSFAPNQPKHMTVSFKRT